MCIPNATSVYNYFNLTQGFEILDDSLEKLGFQEYIFDLKNSMKLLGITILTALVLGYVYMLITRFFAGVMVWFFLAAFVLALGFISGGLYYYSTTIG